MGAAGCGGGLGGTGNEPTHADAWLGEVITGKEKNHRKVQMVNL